MEEERECPGEECPKYEECERGCVFPGECILD